MFQKYKYEGFENVIYSPFGFNSNIYKKLDLVKKYDVSFVGNYSASREWIFKTLSKEGIKVNVFGRSWGSDQKWLSHQQMIEVFNQSKINLNLSNAVNKDFGFLMRAMKSPKALKQLLLLKKHKEQVKGRHYEINGCGGFQLSYFVPGLNLVYEIDKEIAVFEDISNLGDEIKFFLQNDELRKKIADSGYLRSINDHKAQGYLKKLIEHVYNN
jgi:spore maturation protein CgeB